MIPDINLIPSHYEKEESGSKTFYILLTAIFVFVLLIFLWMYFSARSDIKALESEESTLIQQRDNLQTELNVLKDANAGSLEQSVQFVESVSYPVSPIIDELQKLQPEHARFREYSFSEENVTIRFDIETLNEVAQFVSRLNSSPYFTDIQVSKVEHNLFQTDSEGNMNFNEVPRQATEIVLFIDKIYLATGGVQ